MYFLSLYDFVDVTTVSDEEKNALNKINIIIKNSSINTPFNKSKPFTKLYYKSLLFSSEDTIGSGHFY